MVVHIPDEVVNKYHALAFLGFAVNKVVEKNNPRGLQYKLREIATLINKDIARAKKK